MKNTVIYGTGKRKSSIARVFIFPGKGKIIINNKNINDYLYMYEYRTMATSPLYLLNIILENFDIKITVKGGGFSSQAESIRHGITRALIQLGKKEEYKDSNWKKILRKNGYVTRDSREKERKKVGLHKARKHPQFSKR